MAEQRAWTVMEPRRDEALEEAKSRARRDGFTVVTLVRMDPSAGGWKVTLAVRPAA